jgi:hypothetical protein
MAATLTVGAKTQLRKAYVAATLRACITSKLGRAEACVGGFGASGGCAHPFGIPMRRV